MKFGLSKQTIEKINSVWNAFPEIKEVIIYGSRAKNNYRDGSDIDLTIKGKNISYDQILKIKTKIERLNTPYFFDISNYHQIKNLELKTHINTFGKVFYKA